MELPEGFEPVIESMGDFQLPEGFTPISDPSAQASTSMQLQEGVEPITEQILPEGFEPVSQSQGEKPSRLIFDDERLDAPQQVQQQSKSQSKPDSKLDQFLDIPRSIKAGAVDAWHSMAIGADLIDIHVANKTGNSAKRKLEEIATSGEDTEGWKAKTYGFISNTADKVALAEKGNVSRQAAVRQAVTEGNDDLAKGMITDISKGVGGMWDILPSIMSSGGFSFISSPARMFDEGYQDSIQSGKSENEAMDTAMAYSLMASPLEVVADFLIFKGKGSAVKRGILPVIKEVAKKAGFNFLSEGTTEVLQDGILNKLNGRNFFTADSMRTFVVSGFVGLIGGTIQGTTDQVKINRSIKYFEGTGLSNKDAIEVTNMLQQGKKDEATAFIERKNVALTPIIEQTAVANDDSFPLDEKQTARLSTLMSKERNGAEEAEMGRILTELDPSDQETIYKHLDNKTDETAKIEAERVIQKLNKQEAQDGDTERKQTDGTVTEGEKVQVGDTGAEQIATDGEQVAGQEQDQEQVVVTEGKPVDFGEGFAKEQVDGKTTDSKPKTVAAQVTPEQAVKDAKDKKTIALKKQTIETIRDDMDFSGLSQAEIETNQSKLDAAAEAGLDTSAETTAAEVLKKPRVITPEEHAGMVLRAAQIKNDITAMLKTIEKQVDAGEDSSANQSKLDGMMDAMDTLTYASDLSGTEAGRALQIRKMTLKLQTYTLESIVRQAKASKGKKLTREEQSVLTKLSNQIEEQTLRIKQLETEIADIESRKGADAKIEKARKTRKTRKSEDIQAERESIKDQLRSLQYRVNDITGVTVESARLISKLAGTYIDEGAQTLKEVTELVRKDLPDLSDKNIWDSIGGRVQAISKRAKSETQKRVQEIRKQAKLSGQIEDAFNKIFDRKRKGELTSIEVKDLKQKLGLLEQAYRKTEVDDAMLADKMLQIQNLKDQIDGLFRDVKPSKPQERRVIKEANAQISKLLSKIKKIDAISELEEQIRLGKYPKSKRSESKSLELDDLSDRIKFLKEEIALRTRGAVAGGKTDAETIISMQKSMSEIKDQIDKGYRNLPIPAKKRGARVAEVKKDLSEVTSLRDSLDKIADLQEQIRTGNYKVTSIEAKTIKNKELAEAKVKLHQLQRDVRNNIYELRPKTARDMIKEIITLPRSMLATMDMSYGLRQGLLPSFAHPKIAADAWGKAFQAFFSQNKADALDLDIKNHPLKPMFDKYGLHLSNIDSAINNREEFFASNIAEKIPLFGKVVMASERNMVTGLNLLRTGLMTDFLSKHPNAPEDAKKAYANYVNIATGRGDLGSLNGAAEELSIAFFAPRFAVSRIQAPYQAVKSAIKHPELRKELGKQWSAMLGTGATVLALAVAAGAEVGLDPEDSDWGKIIIGGNKRIDIWGGTQQPMRLLALALKATYEKSTTGKTKINPQRAVESFLKYKQAPLVSLPNELITGRDVIGQEVRPVDIGDYEIPPWAVSTGKRFIPLIIQSAVEAYKEGEDPAVVAALATGEGLGLSIGVYDK